MGETRGEVGVGNPRAVGTADEVGWVANCGNRPRWLGSARGVRAVGAGKEEYTVQIIRVENEFDR